MNMIRSALDDAIYFKLKEAEREAELTDKRYSSDDVLMDMRDAIARKDIV